METLSPKTWALVTGASDGIGEAVARQLAAQGRSVLLAGRRRHKLEALAAEFASSYQATTRVIVGDLCHSGAVDYLIAACADIDLDTVVLAAGFGSGGPFLDAEPQSQLLMVDLNCRAVVAISHALATRMSIRGGGSLVLFSSLVGFQGVPNAATYAASKAFIQSFGEGLASELGRRGVRVLTVAPGPVRSGFASRAGMRMGATDSPESVARGVMHALARRQRFLRPGVVGKLLGWSLATLPRFMRVQIMGVIMNSMTSRKG